MVQKIFPVRNSRLQSYVEQYSMHRAGGEESVTMLPLLPRNNHQIIIASHCFFDEGKGCPDPPVNEGLATTTVFLTGYHTIPLSFFIRPGGWAFFITFQPAGINYFTGSCIGHLLAHAITTLQLPELPKIADSLPGDPELFSAKLEKLLFRCYHSSPELDQLQLAIKLLTSETNLPQQKVAGNLGISAKALYRLFNKHLGIAPSSFRALERFDHSVCELSKPASKNQLAKVALNSGYYDQSHFIRSFKKITGYSPGVYLHHHLHFLTNSTSL